MVYMMTQTPYHTFSLALLLSLSLHACAHPSASTEFSQSATPSLPPAALGPGDVFEVRVFGEPDLTGVYRVGSDGSINFPLIGKLDMEGLSASDLGLRLETELKRFLKSPSVSVFIKEYNSKKVYVFGEVIKPGTFPYEENMNIVQAITLAGGFGKIADKNGAVVTRVIDGREQRLRVSVKQIGEGKTPNFRLEPGDIVFVPESVF